MTILMKVASSGFTKIAGLLISSGAIVDQTNSKGRTALIHAAKKGRVESIGLLIAKSANINHIAAEWG